MGTPTSRRYVRAATRATRVRMSESSDGAWRPTRWLSCSLIAVIVPTWGLVAGAISVAEGGGKPGARCGGLESSSARHWGSPAVRATPSSAGGGPVGESLSRVRVEDPTFVGHDLGGGVIEDGGTFLA